MSDTQTPANGVYLPGEAIWFNDGRWNRGTFDRYVNGDVSERHVYVRHLTGPIAGQLELSSIQDLMHRSENAAATMRHIKRNVTI